MNLQKKGKIAKTLSRIDFQSISIALFIAWLVAVVFIRFEPLNNFPNDDSAVFLYIGRGILKGQIPYLDIWDHKAPLLYYIDALGLWIYGLWGVWLVQYLLSITAFFAAYQSLKRILGSTSALMGVIAGFYLFDLFGSGNITEEYSSVFALFAFSLFVIQLQGRKQNIAYFGMGILIMCTFLTRPNNIGFQTAIFLALASTDILNKNFQALQKKSVLFGFGMLIVLVPFLVYFGCNNALTQFFDQVFRFNLIYITPSQTNYISPNFLSPPFKLLTIIIASSFLAVLLNLKKVFKQSEGLDLQKSLIILLFIAFPLEFFLSNLSGRGYNHYYLTWIPYFIIASGYLTNRTLQLFFSSLRDNKFVIAVIIIGFFLFRPPYQVFNKYIDIGKHFIFERANGVEKNHPVSDFIHDNSTPQDKVLRWGFGRWLNYAIERDSPTQYLYQFALATPEYTTDEMIEEFSQQIIQGKPKFIVESINYFIPLDSEKLASYESYIHPGYYKIVKFIEENYAVVKLKFFAVGQNPEDRWIKIWMLKDESTN